MHTVGGLAARTEKELLAIDGLGPQSIKEIKGKLADHGLALTAPGVTADGGRRQRGRGRSAAPGHRRAPSTAPAGTAPGPRGTGGPRPAAAARAGVLGRGRPAADRPAANGLLPPRGARPQDEDALDLLSVAGLPLLKRFAPVVGVLLVAGVLVRIVRRRRRASRA